MDVLRGQRTRNCLGMNARARRKSVVRKRKLKIKIRFNVLTQNEIEECRTEQFVIAKFLLRIEKFCNIFAKFVCEKARRRRMLYLGWKNDKKENNRK